MPAVSEVQLNVVRAHFLDGLRLVAKLRRVGRKPAVLSYCEGQLVVEWGDLTFRSDATGNWPGQATLASHDLRRIAQTPPALGETFQLSIREEKLFVSTNAAGAATFRVKSAV